MRRVRTLGGEQEAADEFVDETRLARAPGARDPEDGRFGGSRPPRSVLDEVGVALGVVLDHRDVAREALPGAQLEVAALQHVVDHALEPHRATVVGAVDPGYFLFLQCGDLARENRPAPAADDPDVLCAGLVEQLPHVAEVLHVPALVARDRDALHVFLEGAPHHLVDGAIVPEVDDLGPGALEDAAHDVDGGVVAVEEARRGDDAHVVARAVDAVLVDGAGVGLGGGGHSVGWLRGRGGGPWAQGSFRQNVRRPRRIIARAKLVATY